MRVRATAVALALGVALAAASTAAPAAPRYSVDLESARVNGHQVLGRSIPGVTASFGAPSWRSARPSYLYRIGYGDRSDPAMVVLFHRTGGSYRAVTVAFDRSPVAEPRLGRDVLSIRPASFAHAVDEAYGAVFDVSVRSHCARGLCSTTLHHVGTKTYVSLGRRPKLGTYLSVWLRRQ